MGCIRLTNYVPDRMILMVFIHFFGQIPKQIERELILSADKASSKIPLMHESRVQRSVGLSLLSRQTGAIAPDHPPKQLHAWVCLYGFFQITFYFSIRSNVVAKTEEQNQRRNLKRGKIVKKK